MPALPAQLENLIGHRFSDPKLLERALTHRSWAFENLPGETDDKVREAENESLEFVGDSVLGLVIAEKLFGLHPGANEGELTLMKHALVSATTLARVADVLRLGDHVRVGRGEQKTGGRQKQSLLANTLEAVIAAVFLDGGYTAARVFISRVFDDELEKATPKNSLDYKTMLQERLQAAKMQAPAYRVLETAGPPHSRTFLVEAVWQTGKTEGRGSTIKSAEMTAAAAALELIAQQNAASEER